MRDVKVGERVAIKECAAILREEEEELGRLLAAKHAERIRVEEVARRFVDAEAELRWLSMKSRTYRWILISGMAVPDRFDAAAIFDGHECERLGAPFVLYERVETLAGEARVFTPDRVDPVAAVQAIACDGDLTAAQAIVAKLKVTVGDLRRREAAAVSRGLTSLPRGTLDVGEAGGQAREVVGVVCVPDVPTAGGDVYTAGEVRRVASAFAVPQVYDWGTVNASYIATEARDGIPVGAWCVDLRLTDAAREKLARDGQVAFSIGAGRVVTVTVPPTP